MNIRAVFLDMDHTLCDTKRADKLALLDFKQSLIATYGHDNAVKIAMNYLRVIYGENRHLAGWEKEPDETEIEFRAKLLEKTAKEICETESNRNDLIDFAQLFMDLRIKHFSFFPKVEDMLLKLRSSYKLILVSNGPLFSQKPKIAKVCMSEYVDHIILGGALAHEKPHPSIFALACKKAKCMPSEAIHVGDKLDSDIKGANNFGITSIWVKPEKDVSNPNPVPDHIISHICELENFITRF